MESAWHDRPVKVSGSISMTEKVCPKCGCKSYYDMSPQVAWCWASGLIEIGDKAPDNKADGGVIVIAHGPKNALKTVLEGVARHGKGASAGVLLVPGVPEAANGSDAVDALTAWHDWCAKRNGHKGRYGVEFVKAV
jgi:hypothetical protein